MKKKKFFLFKIFLLSFFLFLFSCSSKHSKTKSYYYTSYSTPDIRSYKESKELKITYNYKVKRYIKYYTRKDSRFIKRALKRAKLYLPTIKEIFKKYKIPEDLAYLPIVESGFNPYAISSSGAAGLWQFLPSTARRFGLKINRYVDERKDPYKSTIAAAKYLRYLYSIFKDWELVLAAYNCGEGCIQRKLKYPKQSYWHIRHKLPKQTREYVPKFFAALIIAKNPSKYGIYIDEKPIYIVRKKAKSKFHLKRLALKLNINYKTLKMLNAHFKKGIVFKNFGVNIPVSNTKYAKNKKNMTKKMVKKVRFRYKFYKVKTGDTLYSIAKKFNTTAEKIMKFNRLKSYDIKVGQILKIPME